jgi:5-methylcytosine-specific restriction endonuclease McrA
MSGFKKKIRELFRSSVFERDGHRCVMCGRKDGKLDAHHVTNRNEIPAGGYVKENGVTLCDEGDVSCHMKAEAYLQNGNGEPGFSPAELYVKIGSSFALAFAAAERLERRIANERV